MNKSIRAKVACKYLVCALLITGAAACEKEGFLYEGITDQSGTEYLVTDTITMNMSTAYLDSVPTSNMGVALVGTTNDPYFGKITASSFWQVRSYSGSAIPSRAIYDSIILLIRPNKQHYGDTALTQDISVYRVTEEIKRPGNSAFLYSYSNFATDPTPLGSLSMTFRPHRDSIYRIKINDELGREFFDLANKNSTTITNQQQFLQYFKGLALKPGPNSQLISSLRADDSLCLRLFFHTTPGEIKQETRDFAVYNPALQFNHVDVERPAGSPLVNIGPGKKLLPSTAAGNRLYVQPLTNLVGRIDFPYLRTFNLLSKFSKIMRATLTVRPEKATYKYPYLLPANLPLGEINNANVIVDTVRSPLTGGVQYGNLITDFIYNTGTEYTYDITNYCIAQLNATDNAYRGLALLPPRTTGLTTFERTVLGDSRNSSNRITIQIYYLRYK
ncbi:DUF4270 family protein [Chitinophaga rhizophila]|uniref:DUF4270 domain-containing protein n=1 Tax=Chitinophaga rhizophila TaxID=2866212 RepID=A0ABS7G9P5_9BACT|nr:DUF4270 family protein [Chitinophaga rhizophila]MBW8684106.1 DUF4270 domain-containing protein [Chitinophaga rhizophila]